MSKHTPGPWATQETFGRSDIADHECIPDAFTIFTDDGHGNGLPIGYTTANARLIAAAPDLLAALKLIADLELSGVNKAILNTARAAIAKAEGAS